jgi:hypothetical protein
MTVIVSRPVSGEGYIATSERGVERMTNLTGIGRSTPACR